MPRMIPPEPRGGANRSERALFQAFEGIMDRPDWVVLHGVTLGQNLVNLTGEVDFVVIVPGRGILLVEAKSPSYVEYTAGDWYLDRTPSPTKDPLKQLDAARRSIRGFLRERELLRGDEPIARLVWFTSIGRHQFANGTPHDLQFFEWELGWHDDVARPAWLVEKVLDEHNAWFGEVEGVQVDAAAFTAEHATSVAGALLGDFAASETREQRRRERLDRESRMLAEQELALELVGANEHVYFEGPAGTGKTHLVLQAAKRFNREGRRTLVTCWNVLMAEELRAAVGDLPNVEVADLNSLMLRVADVEANPEGAGTEWYEHELPRRAVEALAADPGRGAFEAICVDEFQDVAGSVPLLEVLFALAGTGRPAGTRLVFAGDARQQIMRPRAARVHPFELAKSLIPDLVRVQVRRNCRILPSIVSGGERMAGGSFGFSGHRMPSGLPGGLSRREVGQDRASSALAAALRELLVEHEPEDVVVLSPFGARSSLVGELLSRPEQSADERWLRKQLVHDGGAGRIRWSSIFRFKGLDAEAVVLTDLDARGRAFAEESGLDWSDLVYVGVTRGRYRCVVVGEG